MSACDFCGISQVTNCQSWKVNFDASDNFSNGGLLSKTCFMKPEGMLEAGRRLVYPVWS